MWGKRVPTGTDWPKDFETIKEVQTYVNQVTRSPFWIGARGRRFVHVKPVPNRNVARGWVSKIEIPEWAYSKVVVLHELAHGLAEYLDRNSAPHGPAFVLVFRRLIEQEFGIEERQRYDLIAESVRVSWSPTNIASKFEIRG